MLLGSSSPRLPVDKYDTPPVLMMRPFPACYRFASKAAITNAAVAPPTEQDASALGTGESSRLEKGSQKKSRHNFPSRLTASSL